MKVSLLLTVFLAAFLLGESSADQELNFEAEQFHSDAQAEGGEAEGGEAEGGKAEDREADGHWPVAGGENEYQEPEDQAEEAGDYRDTDYGGEEEKEEEEQADYSSEDVEVEVEVRSG